MTNSDVHTLLTGVILNREFSSLNDFYTYIDILVSQVGDQKVYAHVWGGDIFDKVVHAEISLEVLDDSKIPLYLANGTVLLFDTQDKATLFISVLGNDYVGKYKCYGKCWRSGGYNSVLEEDKLYELHDDGYILTGDYHVKVMDKDTKIGTAHLRRFALLTVKEITEAGFIV